jgi:CheY-like chemotaxis protein/nitrogen-specific signal transduction histidine kinase
MPRQRTKVASRSRRNAVRTGGAKAKTPRRETKTPSLALFAHEIRTTLTGILALGELLAAAGLGERERQWAEAVKGAAEHLADLSSLIVDAAKADAAGLVLRRDVFSPRTVVEAVAAGLAARAAAKGLATESRIADLPAHVCGDRVRLRAALENLIDNAVKFTAEGTVGLAVSAVNEAGRRVRLSFIVSDTGPGLDRGSLRRLFRPFTQANAEIARRYGGAGLGLAAVKRIARAMGGDLSVDSAPGAGSRFRLDVVLTRAQAPPATAHSEDKSPRRLHLLCAEDNPFGRVILATMLHELGHTVDFVASGEAAVERAARGRYDAVLMDVVLPGLDGLAATRRIRALPAPAGLVPIVGVSGADAAATAAEAAAAGMTVYLRKPIGPRALAEALARALGDVPAQAG